MTDQARAMWQRVSPPRFPGGLGQDDMTNVLSATAPGVVAIRSDGKTTEAEVVITAPGSSLPLSGGSSFPVARLGNSDDVHLGGDVKLCRGDWLREGDRAQHRPRRRPGLVRHRERSPTGRDVGGELPSTAPTRRPTVRWRTSPARCSGSAWGTDRRIPGSGYVLPINAALAIASQIRLFLTGKIGKLPPGAAGPRRATR
jgi:hypothetical protein